jgi:hypothetical protein
MTTAVMGRCRPRGRPRSSGACGDARSPTSTRKPHSRLWRRSSAENRADFLLGTISAPQLRLRSFGREVEIISCRRAKAFRARAADTGGDTLPSDCPRIFHPAPVNLRRYPQGPGRALPKGRQGRQLSDATLFAILDWLNSRRGAAAVSAGVGWNVDPGRAWLPINGERRRRLGRGRTNRPKRRPPSKPRPDEGPVEFASPREASNGGAFRRCRNPHRRASPSGYIQPPRRAFMRQYS